MSRTGKVGHRQVGRVDHAWWRTRLLLTVGEAVRFLRVDHAWWRAHLLLAVGEAARVLWEGHVDHAGSRIGFWVAVDIALVGCISRKESTPYGLVDCAD